MLPMLWSEAGLKNSKVVASTDDNLILIGSPEAEAVTRLLFGYERGPGGVRRVASAPDLPYYWLEDETKIEAWCRKFVAGVDGLVARPNWPVVDNTSLRPRLIYPNLTNEGLLATDYLIITRTPNFLSARALQSGHRIVSIAGTHGVGTQGVELLLRDRGELQKVADALAPRTESFQVLARMSDIVHKPGQSSEARKVEVLDVQVIDSANRIWDNDVRAVGRRRAKWLSDFSD